MKRWIPIVGLCVASVVSAAPEEGAVVIGGPSCGEWVARKSNIGEKIRAEAWLLGMLSGIAIGAHVNTLEQTDAQSIFLWMDNYCKVHPLDRVSVGATALTLELVKRMRK